MHAWRNVAVVIINFKFVVSSQIYLKVMSKYSLTLIIMINIRIRKFNFKFYVQAQAIAKGLGAHGHEKFQRSRARSCTRIRTLITPWMEY